MEHDVNYDIIVIGGGIGGSAAALRAVQNGMRTLLITGSKASRKRSRSQWVVNLDNMIGIHEDLLKDQVILSLKREKMESAADHIVAQHYHINNRMIIKNTLQRLREDYSDWATIVEADASGLEIAGSGFTVTVGHDPCAARAVVLATGIMDEQPQFEAHDKSGQLIESPQAIYPFTNRETALYCIRCEGHLTRDVPVAVIGRGEAAAQVACMLFERYGNRIFLLGNGAEPQISDESSRLCKAYGIEIIPDQITDFISAGVGEMCGVNFAGRPSLKVRFAMITMGTHKVYNELARQAGAALVEGTTSPETSQVLIDHRGETSVRGLFAVGDIAWRTDEPMMKQVYTAQEYAVRAVDSIDSRRRSAIRKKALAGS